MASFVYYECSLVVEIGDDGTAKVPSIIINGEATPTIVVEQDGVPGGLVEIDDQHPDWDRLFDTAYARVPDDTYDLTAIFSSVRPGDGYPAYRMDDPRSNG
jgi:hypothetical protein